MTRRNKLGSVKSKKRTFIWILAPTVILILIFAFRRELYLASDLAYFQEHKEDILTDCKNIQYLLTSLPYNYDHSEMKKDNWAIPYQNEEPWEMFWEKCQNGESASVTILLATTEGAETRIYLSYDSGMYYCVADCRQMLFEDSAEFSGTLFRQEVGPQITQEGTEYRLNGLLVFF